MNTTTTTIASTTWTYSMDEFYALFVNPLVAIRFYQIGYSFTFLLGFVSNTASLFTFSRPTLRKISTGCLFIVLAISDILYLLICIFDYLEFGLQVPFYHHVAYDGLCRFRVFVMDVAQLASAWILVIVSLDRWIRTRFPFKSGSICTPKHALIAVGVMLVMDIGLYSHILTPMFGMLIPGYVNGACGPSFNDLAYFGFYYLQWGFVQIFATCLIPVFLMFIILVDIFINVRTRKRAVIQTTQVLGENRNTHQQGHLQKQMFILMFASVCIFLITNLPLAIGKIILPRNSNVVGASSQLTSIWTGLQWFQSFNYAINFYVHCLSSTLFRNEFKQQMKYIFHRDRTVVNVVETELRIQTKPLSMKH